MGINLSVVVCTYNRVDYLKLAIESLLNQSISKENFEIIVVDNGSTDETKALIDKYDDRYMKYLYESKQGLSFARNAGWKAASGEWVAYIDDDAVASPHWVESLIEFVKMQNNQAAVVGGPAYLVWPVEKPAWLIGKLLEYLSFVDHGLCSRKLEPGQDLYGVNCVFRKKYLERTGGFNAELGRVGCSLLSGEETVLIGEITKLGGEVFYVANALVWHHVSPERTSKRWFLRRSYWQGVTSARIELTDKNFLSRIKHLCLSFLSALKLIFKLSFKVLRLESFKDMCSLASKFGRIAELTRLMLYAC